MKNSKILSESKNYDLKIQENNSMENYTSQGNSNTCSVNLVNEKKPKTIHPLKITDTTFRDAHQSLLATRVTTKEKVRICSPKYSTKEKFLGKCFSL